MSESQTLLNATSRVYDDSKASAPYVVEALLTAAIVTAVVIGRGRFADVAEKVLPRAANLLEDFLKTPTQSWPKPIVARSIVEQSVSEEMPFLNRSAISQTDNFPIVLKPPASRLEELSVKQPFLDTQLFEPVKVAGIHQTRINPGTKFLNSLEVTEVDGTAFTLKAATRPFSVKRSTGVVESAHLGDSLAVKPGDEVRWRPWEVLDKDYVVPISSRARYTAATGSLLRDLPEFGLDKIEFLKISSESGTPRLAPALQQPVLLDEHGYFIRSELNPIVNGQPLKNGAKAYIQSTDDAILPNFHDGKPGFVRLVPEEFAVPLPLTKFEDAAENRITHFWETGRTQGKLLDDFAVNRKGREIQSNGEWAPDIMQPLMVSASRKSDPILRRALDLGAKELRNLGTDDPRVRAEFTTRFSRQQFLPENITEEGYENWKRAFLSKQPTYNRMPLGNHLDQGHGLCLEQSLFAKLLADETEQKADMVVGIFQWAKGVNRQNHAWLQFAFPDAKEEFVYDPAQRVFGQRVTTDLLASGKYIPTHLTPTFAQKLL